MLRLDGDEAKSQPADYCIGSGLFNMKFLETRQMNGKQYMLARLFGHVGLSRQQGCLLIRSPVILIPIICDADLYYADPRWCSIFVKRSLAKQVALLHDYGIYDFTILVRGENS